MNQAVLLNALITAAEAAEQFGNASDKAFEARSRIEATRWNIYKLLLQEGFSEPHIKALRKLGEIDSHLLSEIISGLQAHHALLLRTDTVYSLYADQRSVATDRLVIEQLLQTISIYQQLALSAVKRVEQERQLIASTQGNEEDLRILKALFDSYESEIDLVEHAQSARFDFTQISKLHNEIASREIEAAKQQKSFTGDTVVGGLGTMMTTTLGVLAVKSNDIPQWQALHQFFNSGESESNIAMGIIICAGVVGAVLTYLIRSKTVYRKMLRERVESQLANVEQNLQLTQNLLRTQVSQKSLPKPQ